MAPIPLFTGRVGSDLAPNSGALDRLDPTLYSKGAQAAQFAPSVAGAVAEGVTGGVNEYEKVQDEEARTGYLNSEAERNAQLTPLEAKKLQTEAEIAPLRVQTEQNLAEAALNRAKAEVLKQDNDAAALRRLSQNLTDHESAKNTVSTILSSMAPSDPNAPADPQVVGQAISQLENNFHLLTKAAFQPSNDLSKQNEVEADREMISQVANLSYQAERTGDPQIIQRAKALQNRYADVVNNGNAANDKSGKTRLVFNPPTATEASGQLQELAASAGVSLVGSPNTPSTTPIAAEATPIPTQHMQDYLSGGSQPDIEYPKNPLPRPPAVLDPKWRQAEADKPVAQRIISEGMPKNAEDKLQGLYDRQKARHSDIKEETATRMALAAMKESTFPVKEEEDFNKIHDAGEEAKIVAERLRATLTRLQELPAGTDLKLGSNRWLGRQITKGKATLPVFGSDAETQAAVQSWDELDRIGTQDVVTRIAKSGFGTRLIDTPQEKEALKDISSSTTKERLVQALEVLEAKAQQAQDVFNIIDFYKKAGYSHGDAFSAAQEFQELNPATTIGTINGQKFVQRNRERTNVYDWLTTKLHLIDARDVHGRLTNGKPATPAETAKKIHAEMGSPVVEIDSATGSPTGKTAPQKQSFLEKMGDVFSPENAYAEEPSAEDLGPIVGKASDVPSKQPNGVNEATVKRMIQAESSGNPRAEAKDESGNIAGQGLMGLVRSTGRQMWNELGYPGTYNAFDPQKNVAMGMHYLNKLLPWFDNDTRLALAAYTVGPGTISKAYQLAEKHSGDTSWDSVQHYLTPAAAKQAIPYVRKIMGDDGEVAREQKNVTPQEVPTVIASLPTAAGRNNARAILAPDGMRELRNVHDIRSLQGTIGTELEPIIHALLSLNPLESENAEAQTTDEEPVKVASAATDESSGASAPQKKNQSEQGLERVQKRADFAQIYLDGILAGAQASPVWGAVNAAIDPEMQAIALGAARTMAFGWDDELGALLRMAVHGEGYGDAVAKTRAIRESVNAAHPNWYLLGEAGGLVSAAITGGPIAGTIKAAKTLGGLAKGAKAVKTVTEATPIIRQGSSVIKDVYEAGKGGAVFGAEQGAGETEGDPVEGAIEGGIFGAGAGIVTQSLGVEPVRALAKTIWVHGNPVKKEMVRTLLNKLATSVGRNEMSPAPVALDAAERKFVKSMEGVPLKTWLFDAYAKLTGSPEEGYRLVNAIPLNRVKSALDTIAKNPEATGKIEATAKALLHGDTEGKMSGTPLSLHEQIGEDLGKVSNPMDISTANINAANAVQKESKRRILRRLNDAEDNYGAADKELLDNEIKTGRKRASLSSAMSRLEQGVLVDQSGRAFPSTIQVARRGMHVPEETPSFISDGVREAMADPQAAAAISEAHGLIDPENLLPNNSRKILQLAKIILREKQESHPVGAVRNEARNAFSNLKKAMYAESDAYKTADAAYEAASKNLEKVQTKGAKQLQKMNGDVMNSSVPQLMKLGPKEIEDLKKEFTPEEWQPFKDVAAAHITAELEKQARNMETGARNIPDLLKGAEAKKYETIFGKKDFEVLQKAFERKREIQAGANAAIKIGSATAPRLAANARSRAENDTIESAVETLIVGGGAAASGSVGAIAWATTKASRTIQKFLNSTGLSKSLKIGERQADFLFNSKEEGVKTLEKIWDALLRNDPKLVPQWEKTLKEVASYKAARAAGQMANTR